MKSPDLINSIEKFDIQKVDHKKHFQSLKKLQKKFVKDFSIENIENLKIDEYIEGKRSRTSFCYRLERELDKIGNMRGSTAAVFVVYFGKKGKTSEPKYRFTQKLGPTNSKDDALKKVKNEIISLINAGKAKDTTKILSNKLADLFKYKILGTYYPSDYLNLYSHRHLNYFISELGLNPNGKKILDKQNVLLEFKDSDTKMKNWSNFEFNSFLYTEFGRPPSNDEQEAKQNALPAIEKVKPELIDLKIIKNNNPIQSKGKGQAKPNYKKQQERNNRLGKRGENLVYNLEKEFFKKNNFPLTKLIHSSKIDDRLGYDIKSLDENDKVKYIEVKSTRRKKEQPSFIITDNEKKKAEKLPNYYIYIVFEAHTTHPKIWRIYEPFKKHSKKFQLIPVNYRVNIKIGE